MIQKKLIQILLFPFSFLYGVGVSLRNFFYKYDLLKGVSFNIPVISVGNLTVGGAGKTPHIEYLVRYLKEYLDVATLSRGYGRETKGFKLVQIHNNAKEVGDEPLQFKRKFPEIMVAIGESRTFAIPEMLMENPDLKVVLLDDGFQHRSILPGLNILLTEFNYPFTRDFLLPSGRLREWRSAYHRADIIIVTKCPYQLENSDRERLIEEIQPLKSQKIFFSYYDYFNPYYLFNPAQKIALNLNFEVLLISAIARTEYLVQFLESVVSTVKVLQYEDHHYFSNYDISQLKRTYDLMPNPAKIILTTEKDAMRMELHRKYLVENQLPVFVLPIKVAFHDDDKEAFEETVRQFLLNFKI